jgi:hypothetical protein
MKLTQPKVFYCCWPHLVYGFALLKGSPSAGAADVAVGEGVAWSVSARQTFDWPGRIPLRKAIANHQVKIAELRFDQFKTALAAQTRTLAYTLLAGQDAVQVNKSTEEKK